MKHVKFHLPSFLRRVRIHGGEFDSSARAMNRVSEKSSLMPYERAFFAQADLRIVRGSTIERKYMSTKTTFKRIALVAVSALGFGVLSVVPSQAAVSQTTITVVQQGTAASNAADSTTAAIFTVSALVDNLGDTVTVGMVLKSKPSTGTDTGKLMYIDTATSSNSLVSKNFPTYSAATKRDLADTATAGTIDAYGIKGSAAGYVGATFGIQLDSGTVLTAGTYTYTLIVKSYSAGSETTPVTSSVDMSVVVAAAAVATPAAASATAILEAGNPATVTSITDSVTAGSFLANGTPIGKILVTNKTSGGLTANDTITVTMTGVGYLVDSASATTGRSFRLVNVANATLNILADGSSGTGTITITTAAGASFVKTATFFDTKPVSATAVVAKAFIKAGTTAVDDVFAITVKDSLGNAIKQGGVTVTAAPTDTATTVGGAATCDWNVKGDAYHCSVKGLSSSKFGPVAYTIKATGTGVNSAVVVTTSATTTFADNIATKAVLAGPATGTPGATVEYTVTLTEKNGYPVADQTYGVSGAGGSVFAKAVVSGWSAANAPFNAEDSYTAKSGVITGEGVLPIAGTASITLTLVGDGITDTGAIAKTIAKTTVTASTDVANPGVDAATDAANEATDAANAATDAALAAAEAADAATTAAQEASDAVAALSASVTKLIEGLQAQIKSLAAVVAKIAKKVKA